MKRKNLLLTAFLITPFLGLVAIFWAVAYDSRADRRTEMDRVPRIGAGANDTGGANALGELIAGNRATGPEDEETEGDEAGLEGDGGAETPPEGDAPVPPLEDPAGGPG